MATSRDHCGINTYPEMIVQAGEEPTGRTYNGQGKSREAGFEEPIISPQAPNVKWNAQICPKCDVSIPSFIT